MSGPLEGTTGFDRLQAALAEVRRSRLSGNPAAALARLDELEHTYPRSGLLWQERASSLRACGDASGAEHACRRAVELNDALPEAWRHLIELSQAHANRSGIERATAALAKLENLPHELLEGSSRLSEGDLDGAEKLIRGHLRTHGPHPDGMRLLAQVCIARKNPDDAELLLEAVLDRNPHYHEARYELGNVFVLRQRYYPALIQAQHLLALNPADRKTRRLYAEACDGLGRFDEALRTYRELLDETPEDPQLELAMAYALRNQGSAQDAVAGFRHVTRLQGYAGTAYAALADLKTYPFSEEELAAMRRIEADPDLDSQQLAVSFALGKALEDRGQYEQSLRHYARGNTLKRAELSYDPEATERQFPLRQTLYTPEFLAARRGMGCPRADPIFIVGLPRSGSTLLEQILAVALAGRRHAWSSPTSSAVVAASRAARRIETDPRYPGVLAELARARICARLGEKYLARYTRLSQARQPFFIDKMPNNFRACRPDPSDAAECQDHRCAARTAMACCFSNFKQLFANGQEFSYSLEDIGRYYRTTCELMRHWDRALPGQLLRVCTMRTW